MGERSRVQGTCTLLASARSTYALKPMYAAAIAMRAGRSETVARALAHAFSWLSASLSRGSVAAAALVALRPPAPSYCSLFLNKEG